jgi:hypothetical protein
MAIPEIDELLREEEHFEIDNDNKACWALKKIKALKEEIEDKEQLAKEQIYQIESWLDKEKEKRENQIEHFENMLKGYALQLKEEKPDLKTHSLPFGELKFRKQRPKWKYDNKQLLEAAKKNIPSAVRVKEKVYKNDLKKEIKEGSFEITEEGKIVNLETGEIIEGVEVQKRGEKFKVKVK